MHSGASLSIHTDCRLPEIVMQPQPVATIMQHSLNWTVGFKSVESEDHAPASLLAGSLLAQALSK